jgi:hypothetical protein
VRSRGIPAAPIVAFIVALAVAPAPARSAAPDPVLFAFPGSLASPASAASAGVALADRWLGDQPFDNPAFSARRGLELSPALVLVSRQDLRAANRNYVETGAYLEGAGGWAALPLGHTTLFAYGSQPALDLDDNAFTRGTTAFDPANPPAMIKTQAVAREIRAGAGVAWGDSGFRVGAAGEWTRRDDRYVVDEQSGSPLAGTLTTTFSGDAVGFQAGVRLARGLSGPHPLTAGLGVRVLPALSVSARELFVPLVPAQADTTDYPAERGSSWEGGVSVRYGVNATFAIMAAAGGHGTQAWSGLGASAGTGSLWSLAGAFHDPEEPWTIRFGFAQERQSGAAEPDADLLGLGLGWTLESARLDVGALHRGIRRDGRPTAYDDRLVASVGVAF